MGHFRFLILFNCSAVGTAAVLVALTTLTHARTFTDSQGRTMEAEVVKLEGDQVTIRRADGQEFTVATTMFSEADQAFLREWKSPSADKAMEPTETPAEAPAGSSELKPGATIKLEFPELAKTRSDADELTTSTLKLPADYDPSESYPLVVWLPGGKGGDNPSSAFLPEGSWVLAGMPFPLGANNPGQANMVGEFDDIWTYWKSILDRIHATIPNLDQNRSIIAGFSNGAHAIDGVLKAKENDGTLADYFGVFILADGGGSASAPGTYPSMKGKFAYCCYGEKSANADIVPVAAKSFDGKGTETVLSEMKDTGHKFADFERDKVKAWIQDTVLPALQSPGT